MPWKSKTQARWGHSQSGKEALGGDKAVHEWDNATRGKKLPEKVAKSEQPVKNTNIGDLPIKHPTLQKLRDIMMKRYKE